MFGLLAVTSAVLPHMRAARSGRILNMSLIGGYRPGAGFGGYSSTKFAVEGLSEALHAELAPLGIHVTVVEPGYFRTDFLDMTWLSASAAQIADYNATAGKVRVVAAGLSHNQPGDCRLAAIQLLRLRRSINPMPKSWLSGASPRYPLISRRHHKAGSGSEFHRSGPGLKARCIPSHRDGSLADSVNS